MPLKLYPPNPPRQKFWYVRGSIRGERFQSSTGEASKAEAAKWLKKFERDINRDQLSERPGLTFTKAATGYVDAGGDDRFLDPILGYFGPGLLACDIDQAMIDKAATRILPAGVPATRNRQVYTPIAAILRHNGIRLDLKRPKGAQGTRRTVWLRPEQFEAVLDAADALDPELVTMMVTLCYTGMRLGEVLAIECRDIDLTGATAMLHVTKNGDPRLVHLPPRVVAALANHPRGLRRFGRAFKFTKNGKLNEMATLAYTMANVSCGGAPFHVLRHTWATWMVRLGVDLVSTGAWKSSTSARGYTHFVKTEEAQKADYLPGAKLA